MLCLLSTETKHVRSKYYLTLTRTLIVGLPNKDRKSKTPKRFSFSPLKMDLHTRACVNIVSSHHDFSCRVHHYTIGLKFY